MRRPAPVIQRPMLLGKPERDCLALLETVAVPFRTSLAIGILVVARVLNDHIATWRR